MVDEILACYYEDIADKAQMARSSRVAQRTRSAMRRSQPRKPSNRKKAGTIDCTKYMSWERFNKLTKEQQTEYLQYIVDHYRVWYTALYKMWGVCHETVRGRFIRLGIVNPLPVGVKTRPADVEKFLLEYRPQVVQSSRKAKVDAGATVEELTHVKQSTYSVSTSFDVGPDVFTEDIINEIRHVVAFRPKGKPLTLTISITSEEE